MESDGGQIHMTGPRIVVARPGRDTISTLRDAISSAQASDCFAPVLLVTATVDAGRELQLAIADGGSYINVSYARLSELAPRLLGVEATTRPLGTTAELSAVRAALARTALRNGRGDAFRETRHHRSLHLALLGLFREFRSREAHPDDVVALGAAGATARAASQVYSEFRAITGQASEAVSLAREAVAALKSPSQANLDAIARLGTVILIGPTKLDRADADLLATLAHQAPVVVILPRLDDPRGRADTRANRIASTLTEATLATSPTGPLAGTETVLNQIRRGGDFIPAVPPPALVLRADLQVIRAPDPAEEVRQAVRRLLAVVGNGMQLHRTAIVYRQRDPYQRLVSEVLDQAGVPHVDLGGMPLSETLPGQRLRALLRLPASDFSRASVLAWAETGPVVGFRPQGMDEGTPAESVTIDGAAWDWISREAGIVRGATQWRDRLEAYADKCDDDADAAQTWAEGSSPDVEVPVGRAKDARLMARTIGYLAKLLTRPDFRDQLDGSGQSVGAWEAASAWATNLLCDAATGGTLGPESAAGTEKAYLDRIKGVLVGLAASNPYDLNPGTETVVSVIEATLESTSVSTRRLGEGVVVGTIDRLPAVPFDHITIVGMIEGAFPPPVGADPFFPDPDNDPFGKRESHPVAERATFLSAVALADCGTVTLCTPDSVEGREAYPARWLLEFAEARHGSPLPYGRSLRDLSASVPVPDWLDHRVSTRDGARQANGDRRPEPGSEDTHGSSRATSGADTEVGRRAVALGVEDRRIGAIARWVDTGQSASAHPLVTGDLPVRALWERATANDPDATSFTPYDGNVGTMRNTSRTLRRALEGSLSATRFETWATCPYRSFLKDVLRVTPTRIPADTWGVDPTVRGTAVHEVLETWYRELLALERLRPDRLPDGSDLALLDTIASTVIAKLEKEGAAGYPVVWRASRATLVAELREFAIADGAQRVETGLVPVHFEQWFGKISRRRLPVAGATLWPEIIVTVEVPEDIDAGFLLNNGGTAKPDDVGPDAGQTDRVTKMVAVSFRGAIDRVDCSTDGRRASVIDYKTGSQDRFRGLSTDPVLAGKAVQLALYRYAASQVLGSAEVGATYRFVSGRGAGTEHSVIDTARADQRLREVVTVVATGMLHGAFPQVPGNDEENCRICDFRLVCPGNLEAVRGRTRQTAGGAIHDHLAPKAERAVDRTEDVSSDEGDEE
ncbi:MAG: PD-(D/E)XK nuclease family protein [Chloroflexi bacterium]|nr:PD-(D/E)XK nuclease family protein [Chloroflexota bacterium]